MKKTAIIIADGDFPAGHTLSAFLRERFGQSHHLHSCRGLPKALEHLEAVGNRGEPTALVIATESRQHKQLPSFFRDVERRSPMTLRAVVTDGTPSPDTLDALSQDNIDRILPGDAPVSRLGQDIDTLLSRFQTVQTLKDQIAGRLGTHLFVTGATGFVGTRLVREILRCSDARVTALVRARGGTAYDERLPFADHVSSGRLQLIEGDLTLPGLGITREDADALRESVDEVWHLAALTDFSPDRKKDVTRVNVDGVKTILEFAATLLRLRCFNHISTAYVAGNRSHPEIILERVEGEAPEFKNPYEESKYHAEKLVISSGLPHLIYRPSVVFGESYSGRGDGKTLYAIAQVFRMAKMIFDREQRRGNGGANGVMRVRAWPGAQVNLVPVDCVVDHILRIRAGSQPIGTVFHITHDSNVSMDDLQGVILALLNIEHCQFDPNLELEGLSPAERFLFRKLTAFRPYMMMSDPIFDRSNARAVSKEATIVTLDKETLHFSFDSFFQQAQGNGGSGPSQTTPE